MPLCSQITDRIPEMKADALFGANPKSRVTTNTQATSPEMRAERLSNLLAHKSIYISQQDLMRMLMNSNINQSFACAGWMSVLKSANKFLFRLF